jgi:hypothetical protein
VGVGSLWSAGFHGGRGEVRDEGREGAQAASPSRRPGEQAGGAGEAGCGTVRPDAWSISLSKAQRTYLIISQY